MSTISLQTLRTQYAGSLRRFVASPKSLEILSSVPRNRQAPSPDILLVLDASFNPPTLAHLRMASSAILEKPGRSLRLLLLLATQNADKPAKPASFEDRLVMMELFAQDLLSNLQSYWQTTPSSLDLQQLLQIDIGVTKKPYFVDKAAEIESAGIYPAALEQVHLTGYDTLIRIFNPKYYPPTHTLQPLAPFLSRHRLRVTIRPGDEWGETGDQRAFLNDLAQGGRENEGGLRAWAERIQFVEGSKPGEPPVSSTRAREAVQTNPADLEWLVTQSVRGYMLSQNPYPN